MKCSLLERLASILVGFAVGFALLVAIPACGGADTKENGMSDAVRDRLRGSIDPGPSPRFDNTGFLTHSFDLDGDKTADMWKIFSHEKEKVDDVKATIKLVRKELDSNFDTNVDIWFFYNAMEHLFREEADTNFDGNVDVVSYYEKARIVKRELYRPGAEFPTATKFYRDGRLYRVELDDDGNGTTERWEIYTDGRLVQIGYDVNYDGKVDYWNSFD